MYIIAKEARELLMPSSEMRSDYLPTVFHSFDTTDKASIVHIFLGHKFPHTLIYTVLHRETYTSSFAFRQANTIDSMYAFVVHLSARRERLRRRDYKRPCRKGTPFSHTTIEKS